MHKAKKVYIFNLQFIKNLCDKVLVAIIMYLNITEQLYIQPLIYTLNLEINGC